jgi:DNA polymerase
MAEEFFEQLISCIRSDAARHPGQTIRQETIDALFAAAPVPPVPAAVPVPETVPVPAERTAEPEISAPVPAPVSVKDSGMAELWEICMKCEACSLCKTRHSVVFGEGDPHARLMFIGEGPGADEDQQGRPFVGKAGQLLDKMIAAMQFRREEVFIANVVKCRPPNNRVPGIEEANACIGYLKRQIELVQPEVIVLLGATAVTFLLGRQEGITRLRGNWLAYEGIPVMPTYHPAFLLRQESAKRAAWSDLKMVMQALGKTVPGR